MKQTKRILVLRDSLRLELVIPLCVISVFTSLMALGAYITTRNLEEPIYIKSIYKYSIIDSNSYLVLVIPAILFSILSVCCFRFDHKEVLNNESNTKSIKCEDELN